MALPPTLRDAPHPAVPDPAASGLRHAVDEGGLTHASLPSMPRYRRLESGILIQDRAVIPQIGNPQITNPAEAEQLPLSLLEPLQLRLKHLQVEGYALRIAMQQGTLTVPADLRTSSPNQREQSLRNAFGSAAIETFRGLGQEVLDLIRIYARALQSKGLEPIDPRELHSTRLLSSLIDKNQNRHHLPPQLVLHIAAAIHSAWVDIVSSDLGQGHISRSVPDLHRSGILHQELLKTPARAVNMDSLGALCIAFKLIGGMSEQEYQLFRAQSPRGNPLRIPLQIMVVDSTHPSPSEYRAHCAEIQTVSSQQAQGIQAIETASTYATLVERYDRRPFQIIDQRLSQYWSQLNRALIRQEEREVLPSALAVSDSFGRTVQAATAYEAFLPKVRALLHARTEWLEEMRVFGKTLVPTLEPPAPAVKAREQALEYLLAALPSACHTHFQQVHARYEHALLALAQLEPFADEPARSERTSLLDFETALQHHAEIDRLISEGVARRAAGEPTGLRSDYYRTQEFLRAFYEHEGRAVAHWSNGSLNGLFMYFPWPRLVPDSLLSAARPLIDVEGEFIYGRVMVIDRERAAGTFTRLERGVCTSAQLFEPAHLKGFVFERNQGSAAALAHAGHVPWRAEATRCQNSDGSSELHVPYVTAIDPVERQKLRQRAEILQRATTELKGSLI
jgi:hypothetical protein